MGKRTDKIVTAGVYVHLNYCNHEEHEDKAFLVKDIKGRDYTLQCDEEPEIVVSIDDHYLEVCKDKYGRDVK